MSIPYRTVDPYRDTHVIDSRQFGPGSNLTAFVQI